MTTNVGTKMQIGGFAGWALAALQRGRRSAAARKVERQLELVEMLSLGGRKQLALVACGEQRFLVGVSAEGVSSIVAVNEAAPVVAAPKKLSWEAGF